MSRLAPVSCTFGQKNELWPMKKAEAEAQRMLDISVSARKPVRPPHHDGIRSYMLELDTGRHRGWRAN